MQRLWQVLMVVLCFFLLAAAVVSVGQIGDPPVVLADHCAAGCSGGPCTLSSQCVSEFGNPQGCCVCAFPFPGAESKECICKNGFC